MSSELPPKQKHPQNQKQANKEKVETQKQGKSKVETQKPVESVKSNVNEKRCQLSLFDDLPRMKTNINFNSIEGDGGGIHKLLHPTTLKLGLLYRNGQIKEDDDRVLSLVQCFTNIISDYSTPPNKNLSWDLDKHIRAQVQHLVDCRQHSMGMGNLIKSLRYAITQIPPDLSEVSKQKIIILIKYIYILIHLFIFLLG
jgi:translation initiation factor eIF-2B subunit delta